MPLLSLLMTQTTWVVPEGLYAPEPSCDFGAEISVEECLYLAFNQQSGSRGAKREQVFRQSHIFFDCVLFGEVQSVFLESCLPGLWTPPDGRHVPDSQ